jgi:thimet oligopeptidase
VALHPTALPDATDSWSDFLAHRAERQLTRARRGIAALKDGTHRDAADVVARWDDIGIDLRAVEEITDLLANVHPDEAVREEANRWSLEHSRLVAERDLDRSLFDLLAGVDATALEAGSRRLLERGLRDFRRAGVDQPPEVRERLRAIAERSTVLIQDYRRRLNDDVRSVRVSPDRLGGLPADFIDDHPPDNDGLVTLTTEYPDLFPVRILAADADLRRDLVRASCNRGWPDNEAVLLELLELRDEQARLVGYESWADYDAADKMIGSSAAVATFIDKVAELAGPVAYRDLDVVLQRRRTDDPTATGVRRDQFMYYAELIRRERFGVDAREVREYFDFPRVLAGLLDVTGRLFGLDYREVPDAPVWHSDVTVHDVHASDTNRLLGRIYLDLHPRPGKFGHAAQFTVRPGVADRYLPEGALVCNMPLDLMDHFDVTILFHEFGHLLHHLIGGHGPWGQFSGVVTEFDFIEAPSQLLEEWAWNADVLSSFAVNRSGSPIPADLVARMRAAEDFGKGVNVRTQMVYAAMGHQFHIGHGADLVGLSAELRKRYDVLEPLDDIHEHAGFAHLIDYGPAYYTYLWSEVIAKDLFSAFDPGDLFNREIADRYCERVLAPGGNRDASALIEDFLGRPYSLEPFERWLTELD